MNYSNIAYAKVNLAYDRELFVKEYDKLILPNTRPICNGMVVVEKTAPLNSIWKMVPDDIYKNIVASEYDSDGNFILHKEGRLPTWQMAQLMYIKPEGVDEAVLKGSMNGYGGGTTLRNTQFEKEWFIKPEFEKLKIVEFIKTLPFKKLIFIHCVSLEPGQFAGIHRDNRGVATGINTNTNNELAKNGHVVLTLNISDGGVPLYWALDGDDRFTPKMANDTAYITSDYFLHGVPVTTSRRRQIRVTGIPTDDFAKLLDMNSAVIIPDDYEYRHDLMGS